ncbi:MAG: calcium/sodium antiporter [Spongiibacteraceae bacterium]|jgi:cation:H+ antiporter|nr:calcium/sodium antiporter [Spongiibacteraceae bacterium]
MTYIAVLAGLVLLVWSADRFVDGAAATAQHFGMSPLLIGMVIVGFGTSAPEMVVSALAASQGNPGLALGNAYGSNITNIALILGLTVVLSPIAVNSRVVRNELPLLLAITGLAAWQLWDGQLSRMDAWVLLAVFAAVMSWSVYQGRKRPDDVLGGEFAEQLATQHMPLPRALLWLALGLVVLVISSRMLVWGAVSIAQQLGVSDLVIGLTIVAVGTSLPELASSLAATRKGEHDIALGNVLGSNMFNTLAVVGIAGAIHPLSIDPAVLTRDVLTMALLTVALLIFCFSRRGPARLSRREGALLLLAYVVYNAVLVQGVLSGTA